MNHKQKQPNLSKAPNLDILCRKSMVEPDVAKYLFPNLYKKNLSYGENPVLPGRPVSLEPRSGPVSGPDPDSGPVFQKFETGLLDKIFLISDTHFSSKSVIGKSSRPFDTPNQMNRFLIQKWNKIVKSNGRVFVLGDFGNVEMEALLSGKITYILGNCDDRFAKGLKYRDYQLAEFDGKRFVLVHKPHRSQLPFEWDGWVIHGHTHNFNLQAYPFINGEKKTINVSADVINYAPLRVKDLLSLGLDAIRFMKTIDGPPVYW